LDSWLVNTAASLRELLQDSDAVSRWTNGKDVYDHTDTLWDGGKVWSDWTEFINKENILKNIFLMY
jgi:hypothetical protein